jgi:capsular polysaccharide biosynthesis protein
VSADRTGTTPRNAGGDAHGRLWPGESPEEAEPSLTPDPTGRLASLSFVMSSLRRRARLWCATAAIGLLVGAGLYVMHPPPYQASTTILLTLGPNEDLNTAIATEAVLAASRPVAEGAVRTLGLDESVDTFLASCTVAPVTDKVLMITVSSATSSSEAVRNANALATAFLAYRGQQLENQVKLVTSSLSQVVSADQKHVDAISQQIQRTLTQQPPSPARRAELTKLQRQLTDAKDTLTTMQQSLQGAEGNAQSATIYAIKGSVVLNKATPGHRSHIKTPAEYTLAGLVGGAALGMVYVIVQALASSRLRRRDDIALAIGAPVKLSLGRLRTRDRLPGLPGRLGRTGQGGANRDIKRIAEHLQAAIPQVSQGPAGLAVVPVDNNTQIAARSLVELALDCAWQGQRVVLADLVADSPAASQLGSPEPGVHMVNVYMDDSQVALAVAVPERDQITPAGPLDATAAAAPANLARACESADLLLTLAVLDPATGGDHLATWATDAVAIVTAGKSSYTKIHAVGEMIRLAGVRLKSAVLVGADKQDETLGVVPSLGLAHSGENSTLGYRRSPSDPERVFATIDGRPGARQPGRRAKGR